MLKPNSNYHTREYVEEMLSGVLEGTEDEDEQQPIEDENQQQEHGAGTGRSIKGWNIPRKKWPILVWDGAANMNRGIRQGTAP